MSNLYFNEEQEEKSEENTSDNEDFHHSLPQKETKHIHASSADLLHDRKYVYTEQEISILANADFAKTKREKYVVFLVER